MPLPPLPPENTQRLFVDYNAINAQHTVMFRFTSTTPLGVVVGQARQFLTLLAPALSTTTNFIGARYAAAGSTVSNDVGEWVTIQGASGNSLSGIDVPRFVSFSGRTPGGRRVRLYFYGYLRPIENDYRGEPSDDPDLADALAYLRQTAVCGVDGQVPVWYSYFNMGFNAYWQRQRRRQGP